MLIWLTLRTLKYEVVTDMTVARYLWYLYYLPIIFIPLLGVYIAIFWESQRIINFRKKLAIIFDSGGTVFDCYYKRSSSAGICI